MRSLFSLLVCVVACTPTSTPVPAPTICASACAKLQSLHCPEGNTVDGGDSCETVCNRTLNGTFDMKPACLADAGTTSDIVKCGTVRCAVPSSG